MTYDTYVIKGYPENKDIIREIDGCEVVAWSSGHEIAASFIYEEFLKLIVDGAYENMKEIKAYAEQYLEEAEKVRDGGYK